MELRADPETEGDCAEGNVKDGFVAFVFNEYRFFRKEDLLLDRERDFTLALKRESTQ